MTPGIRQRTQAFEKILAGSDGRLGREGNLLGLSGLI
jgi:hypothetical protein